MSELGSAPGSSGQRRHTATATALALAAAAASDAEARSALPAAIDAAHAELVDAGAPESADRVVQACVLLANRGGYSGLS